MWVLRMGVAGGADAQAEPHCDARDMDAARLEIRWRIALEAASAAVDAAAEAHTLTSAECGAERAHIRLEREWFERYGVARVATATRRSR